MWTKYYQDIQIKYLDKQIVYLFTIGSIRKDALKLIKKR